MSPPATGREDRGGDDGATVIERGFRRIASPFEDFVKSQTTGSVLLLACAVAALLIAKRALEPTYREWLHTPLGLALGIGRLPEGVGFRHVLGVAMLAGMGFTLSLFVAGLAYADAPALLLQAKVGILLGSTVAALAGFATLWWVSR